MSVNGQHSRTWWVRYLVSWANLLFRHHCVCVCFLPLHSGHQLRWTYQPGSHRRKVTQDFSSIFFLRCVPEFFSREGFSHSFPSSTVKSNFVYKRFNRAPPVGHFYSCFISFLVRKIPFAGIEFTSQRVRGLRGTSELPGRPATVKECFAFDKSCKLPK